MGSVLCLQPLHKMRENLSCGGAVEPSFSFKGLQRGALGGMESAMRLPEAITFPGDSFPGTRGTSSLWSVIYAVIKFSFT